MNTRPSLDERLERLSRAKILALATCGLALVGGVDYAMRSYEASVALFYLGPVALATWYGGRRMGIGIALLCAGSWYVADQAAGHAYPYPGIAIWNAFVRLGFFLVTSVLLSALRRSLRSQQRLAQIDSLTDLYGRRVFEDRLAQALALARRRKSPLTLVYMDVDDFKRVNDVHGHAAGDRVLRGIGEVLKASVRSADTAARIGGDEFALVLPDTDDRGARRLVARVTGELQRASRRGTLASCSIGVITFQEAPVSAENALAAADKLMYEVKRRGKGTVAFDLRGDGRDTIARGEATVTEAPLGRTSSGSI
jgi:diguanylate cyclase (GGDEF)-like protein